LPVALVARMGAISIYTGPTWHTQTEGTWWPEAWWAALDVLCASLMGVRHCPRPMQGGGGCPTPPEGAGGAHGDPGMMRGPHRATPHGPGGCTEKIRAVRIFPAQAICMAKTCPKAPWNLSWPQGWVEHELGTPRGCQRAPTAPISGPPGLGSGFA